jgi:Transposase DDE domain/Domain of unknown function (DUF4372)
VLKSKNRSRPAASKLSILRQLGNYIPTHLVPQLSRASGAEDKTRSYSAWSHVLTMLYAQLTHALGLNDVCDALRLHSGPLSAIRGATPPSRNGLSHANKVRPAQMAEQLFWKMLERLENLSPQFGLGRRRAPLHRFKRAVHIIDSRVIQLVASCLDWASHRRRKAAAKCHVRLDFQSLLPRMVIVDQARPHDNVYARDLCGGVKSGEIVIGDRAYLDLLHLMELSVRGVYWVVREKQNLVFDVIEKREAAQDSGILRDEIIMLNKGVQARRVVAIVEVDGEERAMTFLTNHLDWSARTICDLYRCRWQIEVFFKQLKQTLQLADFLGNSANAVKWQLWTALLLMLLLRFLAHLSKWSHSFVRLFTLTRSALWSRIDLLELLRSYGTAKGSFRCLGQPEQAFLPGL